MHVNRAFGDSWPWLCVADAAANTDWNVCWAKVSKSGVGAVRSSNIKVARADSRRSESFLANSIWAVAIPNTIASSGSCSPSSQNKASRLIEPFSLGSEWFALGILDHHQSSLSNCQSWERQIQWPKLGSDPREGEILNLLGFDCQDPSPDSYWPCSKPLFEPSLKFAHLMALGYRPLGARPHIKQFSRGLRESRVRVSSGERQQPQPKAHTEHDCRERDKQSEFDGCAATITLAIQNWATLVRAWSKTPFSAGAARPQSRTTKPAVIMVTKTQPGTSPRSSANSLFIWVPFGLVFDYQISISCSIRRLG